MDVRESIIKEIKMSLIDCDIEIQEKIENVLYITLRKYEIKEQSTEIVIHDESNYGYIKKFLGTKKLEGAAESTLKKYKRELEHLILSINKNIKDIATFDIRYYLAEYKERRRIKNSTLEGLQKTFSSFFNWLSAEGIIRKSPTLSLGKIKVKKEIKKPFSSVDLYKIRESCKDIRELALTEFLYATGLRVSEVVSLNKADIDFNKREGIVTGKGNKQRTFYFTEVASEYLQRYLNSRIDNNEALFVAIIKPNNRYKKNSIEELLRNLGERAQVKNVHPHRFRRTLATDLARKGMPIEKIANILGHADIRTTQRYVHVYQEDVKYFYNLTVA